MEHANTRTVIFAHDWRAWRAGTEYVIDSGLAQDLVHHPATGCTYVDPKPTKKKAAKKKATKR